MTDYSRDSRYNTAKRVRVTTTKIPPPESSFTYRSLVSSEKSKIGIVNDFYPVICLSIKCGLRRTRATKQQYCFNESASNNVTQLPAASDWSCILQDSIEHSVVVVPACSRPLPFFTFTDTAILYE